LEQIIKIIKLFESYDASIIILLLFSLLIWFCYSLIRKIIFFSFKENTQLETTEDSTGNDIIAKNQKFDILREGESCFFLISLNSGKHFEKTGDSRQIYQATVINNLSHFGFPCFRIRIDKSLFCKPLNAYAVLGDREIIYVSERQWIPDSWKWEFQHYLLEFDFDIFRQLLSDNIIKEYIFGKDLNFNTKSINSSRDKIYSDYFPDSFDSIIINLSSKINEPLTFYRTRGNQVGIEIHNSSENEEEINDQYFRVKTIILERLAVIMNEPV
jgi:hypothetical protein